MEKQKRRVSFREFLKEKGINPNIGNEASRFYNQTKYKALLTEWKGGV